MERGNPLLRFFDAYVGPILIGILALPRFFARDSKSLKSIGAPQRIGLIKAAALGDTVLLSAIVSDLAAAFPKAQIILFVGGTNAGLAQKIKGVHQVHRMPLKNVWRSLRILRQEPLDLIIDTDSWPRISALWAALAGAQLSVGFATEGQRRHYAFDIAVPHRGDQHEMENYRDLLRALEIPVYALPQNFSLTEKVDQPSALFTSYRQWRDKYPGRICGLHLWPGGTKSYLKEWPVSSWQELLRSLPGDLQYVMTGGPGDRDRNAECIAGLPSEIQSRVFNAAGFSLGETIHLLAELDVILSVNTGVLHLAAAMECPVIGLHGPTNPLRWGPLGSEHISLLAAHPFAGCLNLGFEYPADGIEIMPSLSVQQVLKGFSEIRMKRPRLSDKDVK
ncbi:MAG: hypothetical protein ABS42_00520 [Bdellovibrio sp. SCN 50-8]|nr:MAG: hypothetical protein ABS42_00520 [Bdellovibrio sp. SCN 50-8]